MTILNALMIPHPTPVLNVRRRLVVRTKIGSFVLTVEVFDDVHSLTWLIWWFEDPGPLPRLAGPLPEPRSSFFLLFLDCVQTPYVDPFFCRIISSPRLKASVPPKQLSPFLSQAKQFIAANPLSLSPEGVGGTYFVLDSSGSKYAVFKPVDEEPGAPNNPKKLVTHPLLPPGGGALREVAAYLLDHNFAGVPPTFLVENIPTKDLGSKTGSVQQFITNDGDSSSFGSTSFAVEDVHRIGVLDIRLLNLDRSGENILLKKDGNQHRLIPIDHAYCLPEKLDGAFFEWMYWSQAKKPFSKATLDFIQSIDIDADAKILRDLGIEESCVQTMIICSILLKHCAAIGKNLFEMATLVCRDYSRQPSLLEDLVGKVVQVTGRDNTKVFCSEFESLVKKLVV